MAINIVAIEKTEYIGQKRKVNTSVINVKRNINQNLKCYDLIKGIKHETEGIQERRERRKREKQEKRERHEREKQERCEREKQERCENELEISDGELVFLSEVKNPVPKLELSKRLEYKYKKRNEIKSKKVKHQIHKQERIKKKYVPELNRKLESIPESKEKHFKSYKHTFNSSHRDFKNMRRSIRKISQNLNKLIEEINKIGN